MSHTECAESDQAQPVLVTLPAEVDVLNADRIAEQLAAACAPGVRVVIADMTATTFCDCLALQMLLTAHRKAAANGTDLRLLLPCPNVWRIMKIVGLDAALPTYYSLEQALAGVEASHEKVRGTTGPNREHAGQTGCPFQSL